MADEHTQTNPKPADRKVPLDRKVPSDRKVPPDRKLPADGEVLERRAADDSVALPPSRPSDGDRFGPLVAEIRERLASIASRELALQERERDLDSVFHAAEHEGRDAAERSLEQARAQIAARLDTLRQEQQDVNRRRAQLEELESDLTAREQQLEQDKEHVRRAIDRLERRKHAERSARTEERAELHQRSQELKRLDRDLRQRMTAAREEIAAQRAALEETRSRLSERALELDARQARLDVLAAELQPFREQLHQRRAELEHWQHQLEEDAKLLQAERERLLEQQATFENQWRDTRERGGALARQSDEVQAQRRILEEQQRDLEERLTRAAAREQEYEKHLHELIAAQQELERRQAAVDQMFSEASDHAAATAQADGASEARAAQIDARESDIRVTEQALATRQQELEQHAEALQLQVRRIVDLDAHDVPASPPAPEPEIIYRDVVQTVHVTSNRGGWQRALALSVVAAAAAAALYAWLFPPVWQTRMAVPVVTAATDVDAVLAEHARFLADPQRLSRVAADAGVADLWSTARARGGLRVAIDPAAASLSASIALPNRTASAALLHTLVDPYLERINARPAEPQLPATYADLELRRAQVTDQLDRARDALAALDEQLAALPPAADRAPLVARLEQLRANRAARSDALTEQRAALAELQATPPRGLVRDEDVERLLAQDAVYQQDQKEYQAAARAFQESVGLGLVMLDEPSTQLREAANALGAAIAEQLELNPPRPVAAVLEEAKADADRLNEYLQTLTTELPEWREQLETIDIEQNFAALIELHNAALMQVRRVRETAGDTVAATDTRIESLGGEGGGTRAMVVAAVLRGETRNLASVAKQFNAAAKTIALEENFELDAADRKVRGLLGRMNRREANLREMAQEAADRRAREAHAAKVAELREEVMQLDDAREQLLAEIGAAQEALFEFDTQTQRQRGLQVQRAYQAEICEDLEAQQAALTAELANIERSAIAPDRFAMSEITAAQAVVANEGRTWKAAAAGGSTFLGGLVIGLVLLGWPGQRSVTAAATTRTP